MSLLILISDSISDRLLFFSQRRQSIMPNQSLEYSTFTSSVWFNNCSANDGNLSFPIETVINNNSESLLEQIEWGDVVRRFDCSVQHPLNFNLYIIVFLSALCSLGFPLNIEIVHRIVYDHNLHSKSHYIIKLFMTISSLFTLFTNVVQIFHFIFRRNAQYSNQICNFYVSIVVLSYGTFLFNLFMSLIDCCVMITFPSWHERKVTPRRVVYSLIFLNVSLVMAMKWMFISRVLPVVCAVQILHKFTLRVAIVSLLLLRECTHSRRLAFVHNPSRTLCNVLPFPFM